MKTIILSGAGTGIGRSIAQTLAKSSPTNKLVLIGRNQENLEETKNSLENSNQHHTVALSVLDGKGLNKAFAELNLENVSGVIANAGVGGPNFYGEGDRWDEIIDINLKGTYVLVNEALPYLEKSSDPYRHVVLISSIVAHFGVPTHPAYCSSKAGMLGLMRSWAAAFAPKNILVNAICPGWVETKMAQEGIQGIADAFGQSYEQALDEQTKLLPLQKMSKPEEIAELTSFLLSNKQTSITGEEFQINNGALMR